MRPKTWENWYFRSPFIRNSLIAIGAVVVLCLGGGFILDWHGALEGVLTSVAFSGITIVLGLFFVDKLIEYRQFEQWAKVRLITYRSLATHLCDIASTAYISFPLPDASGLATLVGRYAPNKEAGDHFQKMARDLHAVTYSPDPDRSLSDITVEFYDQIRWDLEQIQSVLTPRLLQSATDQQLIDALMQFDLADRVLYNAILNHKLVVTQGAFLPVGDLIAVAGYLYAELLPYWENAEQRAAKA